MPPISRLGLTGDNLLRLSDAPQAAILIVQWCDFVMYSTLTNMIVSKRSMIIALVLFTMCMHTPLIASAQTTDQPPTIPTNLSASPVSPTQINLTWTASTSNVAVTGYNIYRNGTQMGTSTTNAYLDTDLTPATYYTYTVSAYDAAGNVSALSSAVKHTTLFVDNNVGIICDATPAQQTPNIKWIWQGGVSTCVDKDPITWAVGDFTGFYPTGRVSDYQRGVNNGWYGSQAVQYQNGTFGIELHSDSIIPLLYAQIDPIILDYEYDKTNPPHPFLDRTKSLVWSIQLQIPTAYTNGTAAAHALGYVLLQDTKSRKNIWYGANIFDTRGTAVAVDTIMIDAANGVGTGWPIIFGVAGVNGVYTSNPNGSAPFQSKPWRGFKSFSFSIPYAQMKSTIQALKAKYASLKSLSDDPADYVLLSANFDPEMPCTDPSRPFGPKVYARMGLSARLMKVNVQ